jgi:multidrug efflux pump subunit AcrA (membrane-fusion protein)
MRARRAAALPAVEIESVQVGDIRNSVLMSGLVSPKSRVVLKSLVVDRVAAVLESGSSVSEGEAVISLDRSGNLNAPFSGTVLSASVAIGDVVTQGQTLAVVGDLSSFRVLGTVDEVDYHALQAGAKAQVTLPGVPGTTFEATLSRKALEGKQQGDISLFDVEFNLPYDTRIAAGMSADLEVVLSEQKSALRVPLVAVVDYKSSPAIYTLDANSVVHRVPVTPGVSDGVYVAVTGQVNAGQNLVVSGMENIKDGQRVRVATPNVTAPRGGRFFGGGQ